MSTQTYVHEVSDRIIHLERKLNLFASLLIAAALAFILSDVMRPRLA
jgi:hypothetical protein